MKKATLSASLFIVLMLGGYVVGRGRYQNDMSLAPCRIQA